MRTVMCCCALLALGQFPDAEYAGPAYADCGGEVGAAADWCGRETLLLCVRAGLGPDQVERLFGRPSLTSGFRAGPVEWWYPRLGLTVYWPPRLFRPAGPVERVQGGIE